MCIIVLVESGVMSGWSVFGGNDHTHGKGLPALSSRSARLGGVEHVCQNLQGEVTSKFNPVKLSVLFLVLTLQFNLELIFVHCVISSVSKSLDVILMTVH